MESSLTICAEKGGDIGGESPPNPLTYSTCGPCKKKKKNLRRECALQGPQWEREGVCGAMSQLVSDGQG